MTSTQVTDAVDDDPALPGAVEAAAKLDAQFAVTRAVPAANDM